jgi:hypothetical protein
VTATGSGRRFPGVRPPGWSRWPLWLKIAVPLAVLLGLVAVGQAASTPTAATPTSTAPVTAVTAAETTPTTAGAAITSVVVTSTTVPATSTTPPSTTTATTAPGDANALASVFATIVVAPEQDAASYDRTVFGYTDVRDGAGCNTRARVLIRDSLTPAQVDPFGCGVVAGDWYSLYDDVFLSDPGDIQIDHVVALSEAWRSGASTWSSSRLVAFGNDVDGVGTLRAVSSTSNISKSDSDPANWLPPSGKALCQYITDWVTVKATWGLTMDQAEHTVTARLVEQCTGVVPGPPPVMPAAAPADESNGQTSGDAYYARCADARTAGAAPLYIGAPGYRAALDGDKDGVACE